MLGREWGSAGRGVMLACLPRRHRQKDPPTVLSVHSDPRLSQSAGTHPHWITRAAQQPSQERMGKERTQVGMGKQLGATGDRIRVAMGLRAAEKERKRERDGRGRVSEWEVGGAWEVWGEGAR